MELSDFNWWAQFIRWDTSSAASCGSAISGTSFHPDPDHARSRPSCRPAVVASSCRALFWFRCAMFTLGFGLILAYMNATSSTRSSSASGSPSPHTKVTDRHRHVARHDHVVQRVVIIMPNQNKVMASPATPDEVNAAADGGAGLAGQHAAVDPDALLHGVRGALLLGRQKTPGPGLTRGRIKSGHGCSARTFPSRRIGEPPALQRVAFAGAGERVEPGPFEALQRRVAMRAGSRRQRRSRHQGRTARARRGGATPPGNGLDRPQRRGRAQRGIVPRSSRLPPRSVGDHQPPGTRVHRHRPDQPGEGIGDADPGRGGLRVRRCRGEHFEREPDQSRRAASAYSSSAASVAAGRRRDRARGCRSAGRNARG